MPETTYDHNEIELKWQRRWDANPELYRADPTSSAKKYYVVEMLPLPQADISTWAECWYSDRRQLARPMWIPRLQRAAPT